MNEHVEVYLTDAAKRELKRLGKRDPARVQILNSVIEQIEENGWHLSVKAELIKVLRNKTCIGELRDVGSGGYRLFMFWHDASSGVREVWVCRVLPKSDVVGKARLNDVCDAVEKVRDRFYDE